MDDVVYQTLLCEFIQKEFIEKIFDKLNICVSALAFGSDNNCCIIIGTCFTNCKDCDKWLYEESIYSKQMTMRKYLLKKLKIGQLIVG